MNQNIVDNKHHKCPCGSVVKKTSLKKHLTSKKHQKFEEKEREAKEEKKESEQSECGICVTDQSKFFTCSRCKNKHCLSCHEQLRNPTCPYCRQEFERVRNQEEEWIMIEEIFNEFFNELSEYWL